ncbi:tyrosine-type recombinase/integrase [Novosphingobium sp. FGD1]|uniref:Tyrosine-type recombinase/integrase n=1 Tax=Novosphingobium silvae TaxID=2692619 RepID=A0A7X4GIX6_9SPHN|nr:site-specific integrase [Novosphingobium silvae]MYL98429.1 tyrosine-type recombinase/integrase [Novosphingobium silvae]
MAKAKTMLTPAEVKAADAARMPARFADGTPGLAFVVGKRGGVWQWQGRVRGEPRKITGGRYDSGRGMSLKQAREWANEINAKNAQGVNVYAEFGNGAPDEPTGPTAKPSRKVMTCQEAWDIYVHEAEATEENAERTLIDKRQTWNRLFASAIGEKLLTDITYLELADIVDPIKSAGKRAAFNNAVRYVKRFFTWAEESEARTGLSDSPARRLKTDKQNEADRTLSEVEVRWFWDAVGELDATARAYFLVLLLTGQRRDEVLELVREELDMTRSLMDLSERRMKSKRAHITPFGDKARSLIEGRLGAHKFDFVFPSQRSYLKQAPYSDYELGRALNFLNAMMERKAETSGKTYERWTPHDLRRTFSTLANAILDDEEDTVLDENHIERVMAHKVGGKVANVYNKHQYLKEKRKVLKVWEDEVRRIVGGEAFDRY